MIKGRLPRVLSFTVAAALLFGCVSVLAGCSTAGSPSTGSSTPTAGEDPQELLGTRFVSPYGFHFTYGQLLLDEVPAGEVFASLKHETGDEAVVTIRKPDASLGDPVEWLKTAYSQKAGQKIYLLDRSALDGFPAVRAEIGTTVEGQTVRTIVITAFKDGRFFTLSATLKETNVEGERAEFDLVARTFHLQAAPVDFSPLDAWKAELPSGFPIDDVALFGVNDVHSISGTSLDEPGGLAVFYSSRATYDEIVAAYETLLSGSAGYSAEKSAEKTNLLGEISGLKIEVEIVPYPLIESCNVSVRVQRA